MSTAKPMRATRFQQLALACSLALLSLASHAQAPKVDWVLDRNSNAPLPNSAAAQAAIERFAAAYAKAGKPRVALFWNRELSDRLANDQREVARVQGQASRDGTSFSISASSGKETDAEALRRTTLSERDLWLVETEFSRRLLDAGTVLVDRAVIMRLTGAGTSGGSSNLQTIEMNALTGKADLFLEVLLTRDTSAPLGWGFRSNCKDVKTGRVLGTQYLTAMPELPARPPARYQVQGNAYVLVESDAPKVSLRAIGEALAIEALTELTRRLATAP